MRLGGTRQLSEGAVSTRAGDELTSGGEPAPAEDSARRSFTSLRVRGRRKSHSEESLFCVHKVRILFLHRVYIVQDAH